jgi:hypothetical protein
MMSFLSGRRRRAIVLSSTVMLLASAALVAVSAPAEALSRTKITYKASASRVYAGTVVKLTGRVSPASPARTVYLQRYYSKAWHRIATTRTTAGAYKVTVPTRTTGTFVYRLVVPAGGRGAKASTRSIKLAVVKRPGGNPKAYRFLSSGSVQPSYRWNPCRPAAIGYRVNLANSTAGALTDVKGSIARLSTATGLSFVYRGTTAILPGRGNDAYPAGTELVIAWAKPGQSTNLPKPPRGYGSPAAVGGPENVRYAQDTKGKQIIEITDALVVVNANIKLSGGFGSGPRYGYQGTRGALLMHELGHAVGLDHVSDKVQIMAPMMSRKPARWGAGDKNGLRLVGRSAGCLHQEPQAS